VATSDILSASKPAASPNGTRYPNSKLGEHLGLIARMIKAGASTRVFYTKQDGYDTHIDQRDAHANLLGTFSAALAAFHKDIKQSNLSDRVLLVAFRKFGRRVAENGSQGTDHGTAGPVFLVGSQVTPGLHGTMPSLQNLDAGDIKYSTDFRRIYATLVERWLRLPRPAILQPFPLLSIVAERQQ
jgi:uncharacterized protein (DUF1501 family)